MELHQFRTDGLVDRTLLHLGDAARCKLTALELVAYPAASGVYRVQFVDEAYGRVVWDSYHLAVEPAVGTLMYAGAQ